MNVIIEEVLKNYIYDEDTRYKEILYKSMEYSLSAGGKRVRPVLCLQFCKLLNKDIEKAIPFAVAIEMIHTYSLIHDDLPCMDNDDLRRGKPTNHKIYGEDIALIAGDALLTKAFEVMTKADVDAEIIVKASRVLAEYAGTKGMIGGQCIDLLSEGKQVDIQTLEAMNKGKTCGLIIAACLMGVIVGGGSEVDLDYAKKYAMSLGMAFQIRDDILDVIGNPSELGKNIGMDEKLNKCNYVTLLGVDECQNLVEKYTDEAIEALSHFEADTTYLANLAEKMRNRTN